MSKVGVGSYTCLKVQNVGRLFPTFSVFQGCFFTCLSTLVKRVLKWCCVFSFVFRFGVDLQISDKVFVMDAGASNSKDVKLLRNHLQELRANIISVSKHTHLHKYISPHLVGLPTSFHS